MWASQLGYRSLFRHSRISFAAQAAATLDRVFLRVHLDLDPVPVPGVGGSAGYDSAVLQDHDAKAEARKLS